MKALTVTLALMLAVAAMMFAGCAVAPTSEADRADLENRASATVERFRSIDTAMNKHFFTTAKAWAVFPTVAKGGMGVGGAYGRGVLFEGGNVVGYCDLSQGSIGFQLGGQAYSQIIFFENAAAVSQFKSGSMEFAAQASAVAAAADASANAAYDNGVAVFTLASKGLMYEASIGGQRFDYVAK